MSNATKDVQAAFEAANATAQKDALAALLTVPSGNPRDQLARFGGELKLPADTILAAAFKALHAELAALV